MKKILFTLIIILITANLSLGQKKQNLRIEAEKIAFFTRRMDLTPEEAKEFWPVYNEFAEKRNKIKKERNTILIRYANNGQGSFDEKELEENGDKIIEYMIAESELYNVYHQRFKKILPPYKVIVIYQTESQFNKILLDQLRNQRSQQQQRRREAF